MPPQDRLPLSLWEAFLLLWAQARPRWHISRFLGPAWPTSPWGRLPWCSYDHRIAGSCRAIALGRPRRRQAGGLRMVGPHRPRGGHPSSGSTPRPCLMVGTAWRTNPFELHRSHYRSCAAGGGLDPSQPPVIAIGVQPSTGSPVGMTAVGMIVAPGVRHVRAVLRDGPGLHSAEGAQCGAGARGADRPAALCRIRGARLVVRGTPLDSRRCRSDTLGEPDDGLQRRRLGRWPGHVRIVLGPGARSSSPPPGRSAGSRTSCRPLARGAARSPG